jgi:zinc D-Ala-D-Ala dipeptidase
VIASTRHRKLEPVVSAPSDAPPIEPRHTQTGHTEPLFSDPRLLAVEIDENDEPLFDLRDIDGLWVDDRIADSSTTPAQLRLGVIKRLLTAQWRLPDNIRLLVTEAYRPPVLQRWYFSHYQERLRIAHPEWDTDRLFAEASSHIAPPEVAAHPTGGGINVTLCTTARAELDMGTEIDATPDATNNACYTRSPAISRSARRNRELLISALTSVGMVNYPANWWHWSFGDRYWALSTGAGVACYGPVILRSGMSTRGQVHS